MKFRAEVIPRNKLTPIIKNLKKQGKSICLVAGSWDLLHVGHARFITKAKSLADILIVATPSNRAVRALKGVGRPMIDEKARAGIVSYLFAVDYVTIFSETTIYKTLDLLRPDFFFTVAEEWNDVENSPEAKLVSSYGGVVISSARQSPFISASKIIDRVAGEKVKKLFESCIKLTEEAKILDEKGPKPQKLDLYSPQNQKEARLSGAYGRVLQSLKKCVFCDLKDKYLIKKGKYCALTVALFPYIDGQLMVIPYRHVESFTELTSKEVLEMHEMAVLGANLLKEKLAISDLWQILREGEKAQKTVWHLHLNLIPFKSELHSWHYQKINFEPIRLAKILRGEDGKKSS
ncbi:MAG TPA: adenylyltransferase/cytidyltransferase family protein [Clostridia bacterium]|nr:adenylyltransferase/cytidyltransferase family protein [Clostridia bacterium]